MDELQKLKISANQLLEHEKATHGLRRSLRKLLKEISLLENHIDSVNSLEKGGVTLELIKKATKVQIGAGVHRIKGCLNIDIVPPADFIWDVREGLPFGDNCLELIFSEHFLEHVDYPISSKKVISECFRVLKKGGEIIIGVPDSEKMINNYFHRNDYFYKKIIVNWYSKRNFLPDVNTYIDLLNFHLRDQDDDAKYNPHFWGYDYEKMYSLLHDIGFSKIKKWKFDESIANPKRRFGSLYVIAIK
ncbi:MAG: methyltransferase domain-containing protein [Candidatus Pacebacteria bacterium]|nr:methyltransferase domain-containing protein [Candidatus Paceibacterota bacterium]